MKLQRPSIFMEKFDLLLGSIVFFHNKIGFMFLIFQDFDLRFHEL
jgi:hypothetical protein